MIILLTVGVFRSSEVFTARIHEGNVRSTSGRWTACHVTGIPGCEDWHSGVQYETVHEVDD